MIGQARAGENQLSYPHGRDSAAPHPCGGYARPDEHHLRERGGRAERCAFRADASAMAIGASRPQRQPARLCRHQSPDLHVEHGKPQRRDDPRWHTTA